MGDAISIQSEKKSCPLQSSGLSLIVVCLRLANIYLIMFGLICNSLKFLSGRLSWIVFSSGIWTLIGCPKHLGFGPCLKVGINPLNTNQYALHAVNSSDDSSVYDYQKIAVYS